MIRLKAWASAVAKRVLRRWPTLWYMLRSAHHKRLGRSEPELELLRHLAAPNRAAIDVGANVGAVTFQLARICREVVAVEANPRLAADLERYSRANVRVVHGAASDASGSVELRVPAGEDTSGLATVEAANPLAGGLETRVVVPAIRLGDMEVNDVGFIKIDVEGHELAVLHGALDLISRCRPTLLIEAEERHRPGAVQTIRDVLEPLGYHGYMLLDGRTLTSIARFDPAAHQAVGDADTVRLNRGYTPKGYVTNFIFVPD